MRKSVKERKDALMDEATTALVSTEQLHVEYDFSPNDDGSRVELRRSVWFKAYYAKDRDLLHVATVAIFRRDQVPDAVRDIVMCVAV